MSYFNEHNIGKLIFVNSVVAIFLLGAAMITYFIFDNSKRYDQEIVQIEEEFLERKKSEIKRRIDFQVSRVESRSQQTLQHLKERLQQYVTQAGIMANHIYQQNRNRLTKTENCSLIAEALRFYTYNQGNSYLFMWSKDGTCWLNHPNSGWEGKNVNSIADADIKSFFAKIQTQLLKQGDGFHSYQWPNPEDSSQKTFSKTSYISYLEDLDCYIGAGEFLSDFTKELQRSMIDTFNHRQSNNVSTEYFFINKIHDINGGDNFATVLVNPNRPDLIGKKISDSYKDARGKEFCKEFLQGLRDHGETFVRYWYKKPGSPEPKPKISYFKLYPEWNWMFAKGFYFDDLESLIIAKKASLQQKIRTDIIHSLWILTFFLVLVAAISLLFSKKINRLFQDYREHLETSNRELNRVNMELATEIKSGEEARREVDESYVELDLIFNVAANAMVKISANYKIERVNNAFAKTIKLDKQEIIGCNCFDIVKSDLCLSPDCPIRIFAEGGTMSSRVIKPEMHQLQIPAVLTSAPLYNSRGNFSGIIEDFYDLSQIKEKERELERFRRMVEQTGDGIALADMEGNILFVNPAWATMHGYEKEVLTGHHLSLFHTQIQMENEVRPFNAKVKEFGEYSGEVGHKRQDNSLFPSLMTTTILADDSGKAQGLIATIRDISELVKARKTAWQANRAKSEFLANMSHEIRTPMNAIIVTTSLLLEDTLSEKQQQSLAIIRKSGEALLSLINNILDFSKIEAGKFELEESCFRPEQLISETVQSCTVLAEGKGLIIVNDTLAALPDFLIGDPLRIRQVIINLLNNAIKFTDKGSITVSLREISRNQKRASLRFLVRDTGIGMNPEVVKRIFQSFNQGDPSITRRYGGTGLGLAISRDLVKLMGGNLKVSSREGQGSTFEFTLSFKLGTENQLPLEIEFNLTQAQQMPSLDILIVDDVQENRLVASMVLEKYNHRLESAVNGHKALEQLADNNFDAVLMDLQMPVMDGLTATSHIRACERGEFPEEEGLSELLKKLSFRIAGRHLVIIGLTADAFSETREKALSQGMDACLTKPFKPREIITTLARFSEMRETDRALKKVLLKETPVKSEPGVEGMGVEDVKVETLVSTELRAETLPPLFSQIKITTIIEHFKSMYALDEDQALKLIESAKSDLNKHLSTAEENIKKLDLGALAKTAHAMKGVLLNLGLSDQADLAREIEQNAEKEKPLAKPDKLAQLRDYLSPLLEL